MTRRLPWGLLAAALLLCAPDAAGAPPRATSADTAYTGRWTGQDGSVAAFLGVPFARPPVGQLRWRPPQPLDPAPATVDATTFAPACMQGAHISDWYAGVAADLGADPAGIGRPNGVSEDCLYLNVWTPEAQAGADLPVMLWVHGGSNAGGWSYEPNYIGDRLAARGVVVVSVAYRVGPFGFFSHPALEQGTGEPMANFGWLDIIASLKWVQRHIYAFGGDPDNVTLMGESSGAANIVDIIMQETDGQGPYRRVVLQSAPIEFGQRRTLAQEQATGARLARHLGIEDDRASVERLRAIPAADLVRAADTVLRGHYFSVVDDGVSFQRGPTGFLESPALGRVDLLIGTNAHEWLMYIDEQAGWPQVEQWLRDTAPDHAAVLHALFEKSEAPRHVLDRLNTARRMACPARHLAARVGAAGGRAWVYHFSRQRPGPEAARLGAYHGTEIGYVFDRHEYWQPVGEWDRRLTRAVMEYWVAFARSGDPNGAGRPAWPPYRAGRTEVLDFGDRLRTTAPPDADLCLWLGPGLGAAP